MKLKRQLPILMFAFMLASCGKESKPNSVSKPISKNDSTSTKVSETAASAKGSESTAPEASSFVMEAEYTNVTNKHGAGYSGGSSGKEMIQQDEDGKAKASNGFWLGYLYVTNLSVDFVFNSTKAVNDVTLILRLSAEIKDVVLTSDNYTVNVNGTDIKDYGTITLSGTSATDSDGYVRPFSNHKLKKKINLVEGENTIKLITSNSDGMGGTMYATAPMVDCVTLTDFGDSQLSYDPILDNLSLFNE